MYSHGHIESLKAEHEARVSQLVDEIARLSKETVDAFHLTERHAGEAKAALAIASESRRLSESLSLENQRLRDENARLAQERIDALKERDRVLEAYTSPARDRRADDAKV